MSRVYSVEQVRAVEQRVIDQFGVPEATLMERAGEAAFEVLRECWPEAARVAVICGPGNNGGDGRVLARLAAEAGMEVIVVALGDSGAAHALDDSAGTAPVDVIVDALFGIGLSRVLDGDAASLVDAINTHPAAVLSLDIPSGLHGDTGVAAGPVVVADLTVTFIAAKRGLFTADGPRVSGQVIVSALDIPDAAHDGMAPVAGVLPTNLAAARLGPRPRDAHKGMSGHVLVVGGHAGMRGAAQLTGEAALRCGAGRVSLAVAPGTRAPRAELMVHEVPDAGSLAPLIAQADVIAVGPGLGTDAWSRDLLDAVLASDTPLVVDADALNLLAGAVPHRDDWILTPHPGEAARLLGISSAAVQRDRYSAIDELVAMSGGVVVLKGAATLVAAPQAVTQVCVAGNPGMAAAGFGDVLTGTIAALWGQGLDRWSAATAGVQLHAEAGDVAAGVAGERGLLAGDLMEPLQWRVNGLD
jgi:ADP-dependent NAD(P)H-hydrate dehydratase / NAD(P)H-hydrate epimerase